MPHPLYAWRSPRFATDSAGTWNESDHPRGQPENAGQFGPNSGSEKFSRKEQRSTLGNYQHGMRGTNANLRKEIDDPYDKRAVAMLDQMMTKLPRDRTLYRGVGPEGLEAIKSGRVDRGFMSASTSRYIGESFAQRVGSAVVELRVPKGYPVIDIEKRLGAENREGEGEFILARGTRLIVNKIEKREGKPDLISATVERDDFVQDTAMYSWTSPNWAVV